jgi:hypothetical protein
MPLKTKADKQRAARALAHGSSKAAAARTAKVNRATIQRWMDDPEFQDLVLEERELLAEPAPVEEQAIKGLSDLVADALVLLKEAMTGKEVTAARARIALDVIVKAASLEGKSAEDEVTASWGSIVEALDARGVGTD